MNQPNDFSHKQSWIQKLPFHYGWLILVLASVGLFISGPGQTYSISIFVNPIIEETGWSRTAVSGLYTGGSLLAASTMIFIGKLLDKFGARVMLTAVVLLFGTAALGMSQVQSQFQLFLGFAAIRILGQGSLILIPSALVSIWFVKLRGRATALSSLGIICSQAAFPPLILILITVYGWRGAWVVLAFIIWGVFVVPAVLLTRKSPESVGLLPDAISIPSKEISPPENISSDLEVQNFTLNTAMKTISFWLLLFASSAQSMIGTALVFHQISLFENSGLSADAATVVLSLMGPSAFLGTFMAGYSADKLPNRLLISVGQIFLVISMACTLLLGIPGLAYLYGILLGFGAGFLITVNSVIWPNYYGRKYIGSIRGVATATSVASAALGPLPFGFLYDFSGSYSLAIIIFIFFPLFCALAAFFAIPPYSKEPSPQPS